jgi:hypothetical protein
MIPNTNQGYFSVELGLFYYILKKKYCVFESGPKNINFKIKVFFGFFFNYFSVCFVGSCRDFFLFFFLNFVAEFLLILNYISKEKWLRELIITFQLEINVLVEMIFFL